MSNKFVLAALLVASGSVFAGPTIGEINSINAELKKQELQNKLDEAKNKHTSLTEGPSASIGGLSLPPPLPAAVASPPITALAGAAIDSEEIKLLAIYGVGKDLKAEVLYNGNSFTLSAEHGNAKLGSWTVTEITPSRLILAKENIDSKKGKGKDSQKEVYLSSSTSVNGDTKNLNLFASPGGGSNTQPGSYVPVPPSLPPAPVLPVSLPTRKN